jgi:hypothetical protein
MPAEVTGSPCSDPEFRLSLSSRRCDESQRHGACPTMTTVLYQSVARSGSLHNPVDKVDVPSQRRMLALLGSLLAAMTGLVA